MTLTQENGQKPPTLNNFCSKVDHEIDSFLEMDVGGRPVGEDGRDVTMQYPNSKKPTPNVQLAMSSSMSVVWT